MMDGFEEDEFRRLEGYPERYEDDGSALGWFIVALATAAIALVVIFWPGTANAADYTDQQIVEAIYKAEGGSKAQYLYGIRSVKYSNAAEARRICFNTVKNNRKRWAKAGNPGEYLEFLARRYCPVGADNDPRGLNRHWLKNVKHFLSKGV